MTTPFIIWLNKSEVDELITSLLTHRNTGKQDDELLENKDLLAYAQSLLHQNRTLIDLIEKIQPLNPLQKRATATFGVNQKCVHYKEELKKMDAHCSVYNSKLEKKFKQFAVQICEDCSRKGLSDCMYN